MSLVARSWVPDLTEQGIEPNPGPPKGSRRVAAAADIPVRDDGPTIEDIMVYGDLGPDFAAQRYISVGVIREDEDGNVVVALPLDIVRLAQVDAGGIMVPAVGDPNLFLTIGYAVTDTVSYLNLVPALNQLPTDPMEVITFDPSGIMPDPQALIAGEPQVPLPRVYFHHVEAPAPAARAAGRVSAKASAPRGVRGRAGSAPPPGRGVPTEDFQSAEEPLGEPARPAPAARATAAGHQPRLPISSPTGDAQQRVPSGNRGRVFGMSSLEDLAAAVGSMLGVARTPDAPLPAAGRGRGMDGSQLSPAPLPAPGISHPSDEVLARLLTATESLGARLDRLEAGPTPRARDSSPDGLIGQGTVSRHTAAPLFSEAEWRGGQEHGHPQSAAAAVAGLLPPGHRGPPPGAHTEATGRARDALDAARRIQNPVTRTSEMVSLAPAGGSPAASQAAVAAPPGLTAPVSVPEIHPQVAALARMVANLTGREEEDLLTDTPGGGDPYRGAKGVSAYARERDRFRRAPGRVWLDFALRARETIGIADTAPWRVIDLLPKLPFGSFVSMKRFFALLAEVTQALLASNHELALGLCTQGLRWVALHLDMPSQPDLAWNITFLPDPRATVCVDRAFAANILNEGLQDARQLTSVLGMAKDLELIRKATTSGPGAGPTATGAAANGADPNGGKGRPKRQPKGGAAEGAPLPPAA